MIVVAESIELEEGWVDEDGVREAISAMEQASRTECGCHAYATSIDVSDPAVMRIYEVWESIEALQAHCREPHMAALQASLGHLQPKAMDAKVYEIGREVEFAAITGGSE